VQTFSEILPPGSVTIPGLPGTLPDVKPPGDPVDLARKRLIRWGALGVAVGAGATGVGIALAFKSYRKSKSKSILKPALWSAAASATVGGTLLWILARGADTDDRVASTLIGIKLAT
jgi:hypothetical protein